MPAFTTFSHPIFLDYKNFFFYCECSKVFLMSYVGILKYKMNELNNFLLINNITCFILNFVFFLKKKTFLFYFFFKTLIETVYGSSVKFKIIGLGYKSLYSNNLFFFRLGYSHLVFFFSDLNTSSIKKKKKKKFFKLYGFSSHLIATSFNETKKFRTPGIFSMNGIFNRKDFLSFKKGKKSFLM